MSIFDKFSGINIASGFKLQAAAPLDPRQVVDSIEERDALITEKGAFEGMQVYVKADKKTYLLKDLETGTWEEVGQGAGKIQSNWLQNDATAADYIQNRPFYSTYSDNEIVELYNGKAIGYPVNKEQTLFVATTDGAEPTESFSNIVFTKPIKDGDIIVIEQRSWEPAGDIMTELKTYTIPDTGEKILYAGNLALFGVDGVEDNGKSYLLLDAYAIGVPIGTKWVYGETKMFTGTVQINAIRGKETIKYLDSKYIKDMYRSEDTTGVIANTTVTATAGKETEFTAEDFPPLSKKCIIQYNGTEYTCPISHINSNIKGNGSTLGDSDLKKYPFYIWQYLNQDTSALTTTITTKDDYSGDLVITYKDSTVISGVDDKYIGNCRFNLGNITSVFEDGDFDRYLKDIGLKLLSILQSDEELQDQVFNNSTTRLVLYGLAIEDTSATEFSYTFRSDLNNEFSSKYKTFSLIGDFPSLVRTLPNLKIKMVIGYSGSSNSDLYVTPSYQQICTTDYSFTIADALQTNLTEGLEVLSPGELGFLTYIDDDGRSVNSFNGTVKLKDWIKYSQPVDDFQIPEPSKETDLVDKKYVDSKVTGAVKYLGTVKTLDALTALTSNKGDFCRVETAFNLAAVNSASGSEVSLHASDMLICESIKTDSAAAKWSVIHGEIDSNTWVANTKTAAGYVAAGGDNANKVWKTDSSGAPGWRDDANTIYSDATTSTHGLMSTADKQKLDGLNDSNYVKTSGSQSINGTKTFNDTQNFKGYLNIYGTAAEKHLKTRGIAGSDGNGAEGDLYLQYSSDNKTLFGKTGNSSLNSDGSVTIEGKTAATTDQLPAAVSANPTLSGSETELTGLKIGSTNYKIPSSSGSSGSTVTPLTITQVTGSENQIGGLMIDDKKYCFYQLTNKVGNYIAKLTPENTMWTLDNAYGSFQTPGYLIAGYGSSTSFENAVALGPSGLYIMNNWNKYKITLPDKESTLATIDYVTGNATVPDGSVTLDLNTLKIGGVYFKIPTVDTSEFVTLSGDQTITGKNTFTLQQTFNTSPICQSCITVAAAINTTAAPIAYYNFSSISYKSADSTIYTYSFPSKTGVLALTSDIVANPTLAGTEKSLTGITIKGTSYKIASGSGSGGVTAAGNNTFTGNNTFSSGSITLLTNGGTGGKAIYSSSTIQYTPAKSSTKYVISLPEKEGTLAIEENTIQKLYRHQITISGTDDTYGKCQVTLVTDSTVSTAWDPATEFSAEEPQVRLTYNPCTIVYNDNANITNGVFVYNDSNTIVIMAPVIESGESTNATFSLTSITVSDNTYLI